MENHSLGQDCPSSRLDGALRENMAEDLTSQAELERLVAQIWSKVLRIGAVGLHDNFFDLGGHSLAIVKVYDQLQVALPNHPAVAALEMVELFEHPTVGALSAFLARGRQIESKREGRRAKKQASLPSRKTQIVQTTGGADE
jgi:hypothetical protein